MVFKHKLLYIIISILMVTTVVGCSASEETSVVNMDHQPAVSEEENMERVSDAEFGFSNSTQKQNEQIDNNKKVKGLTSRKIIKSSIIGLETLKFDDVIHDIVKKTNRTGGYIEQSSVTGRRINHQGQLQNRYGLFKLRIPKYAYDGFLLEISDLGNIIRNESSGQDITNQYFDTEARVKALEVQEERLLEIMKKSDEIEDIISLERRLSELRYEIENLTGTLKKWDNLVEYATLTLEVYEVQEEKVIKATSVTLGEKMTRAFNQSIEVMANLVKGLLILIATLVPFLVIVIPLFLIIIFIWKHAFHKKNKD